MVDKTKTKKELKEYAEDELGIEIDSSKLKAEMIKEIEKEENKDEKVEKEVEEASEEDEEKEYFGVNSIPVRKIEDIEVNGKKQKKVFLWNGITTVLTEDQLKIRLEEGEE